MVIDNDIEATEEQLREVLADENKDWKCRNDHSDKAYIQSKDLFKNW